MDSKAYGAAAYSTESGRHTGTTLTDAVRVWPTPLASDANGEMHQSQAAIDRGFAPRLQDEARSWATPIARDGRTAGAAEFARDGAPGLRLQAIEQAGSDGLQKVDLNPAFVEALMGLPDGWTGFARSATP